MASKPTILVQVKGRPRSWSGHGGRYFPRKSSLEWQKTITTAVEQKMVERGHPTFGDRPVSVALSFRFKRPKKSLNGYPDYPRHADIDKLARVALDALVHAGLIDDDRHVVYLQAMKLWGDFDGLTMEVNDWSES